MRFGSVCSGIEAASVAWEPLGWQAAWLAEIEPFPAAVLAHRFPGVPNLGDMTRIARRVLTGDVEAPDVLVGGTPCQAFSVAGMREGLADSRGQLTIKFVELADAIDFVRRRRGQDSSVIVWENVPGVLSSKDNAFGCFLAALAGEDDELVPAGEKWSNAGYVLGPARAIAWRILDAQYFGVAQRRRRVFVVASSRKGFDPRSVLFESGGVRRDSAPCRGERQETAATLTSSLGRRCGVPDEASANGHLQPVAFGGAAYLTANGQKSEDGTSIGNPIIPAAHTLPFDTSQLTSPGNYSRPRPGDPCHPLSAAAHAPAIAFAETFSVHGTQDPDVLTAMAHTLGRNSGQENAVLSVTLRGRDGGATAELGDDLAGCLRASGGGGDKPHALTGVAVRRLTPVECERLQGFPDGWTDVPYRGKPAADSPRYKAIGNSMAVPVMSWIGKRIEEEACT
ncbi:DNA cytosine methyltransferase [Laribacter hongkongensis]|uniref:DNA cytosine methyltransferase n=1 Tax=Laribacter hongkongensis TaxID=168471 RepID=UPI001EFE8CA9|nr:DNA cytosine methyltransferase [Laribacter hongkongensis]MCG9081256.1 DNA cytosine methyltransferase [Laribacter hongkongensis]